MDHSNKFSWIPVEFGLILIGIKYEWYGRTPTVSDSTQVVIGAVPDRGGVPEGYTLEDVAKDVTKANIGLAMKDAP